MFQKREEGLAGWTSAHTVASVDAMRIVFLVLILVSFERAFAEKSNCSVTLTIRYACECDPIPDEKKLNRTFQATESLCKKKCEDLVEENHSDACEPVDAGVCSSAIKADWSYVDSKGKLGKAKSCLPKHHQDSPY